MKKYQVKEVWQGVIMVCTSMLIFWGANQFAPCRIGFWFPALMLATAIFAHYKAVKAGKEQTLQDIKGKQPLAKY